MIALTFLTDIMFGMFVLVIIMAIAASLLRTGPSA
jgi:hypothetical protein